MITGIELRLALPSDAEGILQVKQAVWPTQDASLEQVSSAISDTDHQIAVAVDANRIVGYMSCFKTLAQDGHARWEMDELAVHPEVQGRSIGRDLVKMGTRAGRDLNIPTARALIQVDNVASQRTFARWGYIASDSFYGLYICTNPLDEIMTPPADLHLVPVNTISYRGVWLEGQLSKIGFLAARAYCAEHKRSVAGALIPITNRQATYTAANSGYEALSNYQWWTLDLEG
jgi:L-amino acid N-acyltransferase YncA